MAGDLHLHVPTLTLFGHLLLLALAATLMTAKPVAGRSCSSLRIWTVSILVYLFPAPLLILEQRNLWPAYLPAVVVPIFGALASAAILQWLALREAARPGISRLAIALVALGMFVAAMLITWLLPQAHQHKLISTLHIVIPIFALPWLLMLARQNIGGYVVATSLLLSTLPNLMSLTDLVNTSGRDPSWLILFDTLALIVATMGLLLWHLGRVQELLMETAITDALTGVLNRHGLMPQIEKELARANRDHTPLSLAICDLDHFKKINDTYGHVTGDEVLKDFALRIHRLLRQGDLFGRWGGEEFVLTLPNTASKEAVLVVERLKRTIVSDNPKLPPITFSAGVATAGNDDSSTSVRELLTSADKMLYLAKEKRDCIVANPPLAPS